MTFHLPPNLILFIAVLAFKLHAGRDSSLAAQGVPVGPSPRASVVETGRGTGKAVAALPSTERIAVGPRIGLGIDPVLLPTTQRAQAEPYIARSPADPDLLVAVFQDGRFETGGAITCGYAISTNGGLNWRREVFPKLTQPWGGPYFRATDPVVAIDHHGVIYLSALGALDRNFDFGAIVVSRSLDGGKTFSDTVEVARSTKKGEFPDKNWMTVNAFTNAVPEGRLVVTYTRFVENLTTIEASFSDDGGKTWSPPVAVTPPGTSCQSSQPVFLPDGTLAIVYWNFGVVSAGPTRDRIDIALSKDGGRSFSAPSLVAPVTVYDSPGIRDGYFVPSATADRVRGDLMVVWQGKDSSGPRIFFTRSNDGGRTWGGVKTISDNPDGAAVVNPALGVSPDGKVLSVIFQDQRLSPGNTNEYHLYSAKSVDGGTTWLPNEQLSERPLDIQRFPRTSTGFMIGDYLGVAASAGPDVPAVAIWIDTAEGEADPAVIRFGMSSPATFTDWRAARFSNAEIRDSARSGPGGDWDGDGVENLWEYALGSNPKIAEAQPQGWRLRAAQSGADLVIEHPAWVERNDFAVTWERSRDLQSWESFIPTPIAKPAGEAAVKITGAAGTPQSWFFRLSARLR